MISEIFSNKIGGGLRGDPHMWRYLEDKFVDFDISARTSEFKATLEAHFYKLLFTDGDKVTAGGDVFISSFPQVGVSGGVINYRWWVDEGIPLLCERYANLKNIIK